MGLTPESEQEVSRLRDEIISLKAQNERLQEDHDRALALDVENPKFLTEIKGLQMELKAQAERYIIKKETSEIVQLARRPPEDLF